MGKSTISMAILNSYVSLPEGIFLNCSAGWEPPNMARVGLLNIFYSTCISQMWNVYGIFIIIDPNSGPHLNVKRMDKRIQSVHKDHKDQLDCGFIVPGIDETSNQRIDQFW
jgi:hypothetical protein